MPEAIETASFLHDMMPTLFNRKSDYANANAREIKDMIKAI